MAFFGFLRRKSNSYGNPCGKIKKRKGDCLHIVKSQITYQLRNYQRNKTWLDQVPHIRYLDLAIIFCFRLPGSGKREKWGLVTWEQAQRWEMDLGELECLAQENTRKLLPMAFYTLEDMIRELSEDVLCLDLPASRRIPMYVLTNQRKFYGAAAILYPHVLEAVSEKLGDAFYVLPSSIHECILVPESGSYKGEDLERIVREINATQVPEEEILSDRVYYYSKSGDSLSFF